MQVFLHDDIAAAGRRWILVADQDRVERGLPLRVFGAVDKAEEVALVEIAEAVHLVGDRYRIAEAADQLACQLEAQIHALGADVEQDVAGRRDGLARPGPEFAERVQFRRARRAEQPVPNCRPERHDAGQIAFEIAKSDRPQQGAQIGAQGSRRRFGLGAGLDRDHKKDRGAGQLHRQQLRQRARSGHRSRHGHSAGFRLLPHGMRDHEA